MQTVKINGNVQNPFSVSYAGGRKARYYIHQSGGFAHDAHKSKAYVQYANGATGVRKGFIFKSYPKVEPGSVVIVPQKAQKKAREWTMDRYRKRTFITRLISCHHCKSNQIAKKIAAQQS